MSLFLVSKYKKMACSCTKSPKGWSESCKYEWDYRNTWNVGGNIENDDKYSDEEEYGSKDEDDTDNLLE